MAPAAGLQSLLCHAGVTRSTHADLCSCLPVSLTGDPEANSPPPAAPAVHCTHPPQSVHTCMAQCAVNRLAVLVLLTQPCALAAMSRSVSCGQSDRREFGSHAAARPWLLLPTADSPTADAAFMRGHPPACLPACLPARPPAPLCPRFRASLPTLLGSGADVHLVWGVSDLLFGAEAQRRSSGPVPVVAQRCEGEAHSAGRPASANVPCYDPGVAA